MITTAILSDTFIFSLTYGQMLHVLYSICHINTLHYNTGMLNDYLNSISLKNEDHYGKWLSLVMRWQSFILPECTECYAMTRHYELSTRVFRNSWIQTKGRMSVGTHFLFWNTMHSITNVWNSGTSVGPGSHPVTFFICFAERNLRSLETETLREN